MKINNQRKVRLLFASLCLSQICGLATAFAEIIQIKIPNADGLMLVSSAYNALENLPKTAQTVSTLIQKKKDATAKLLGCDKIVPRERQSPEHDLFTTTPSFLTGEGLAVEITPFQDMTEEQKLSVQHRVELKMPYRVKPRYTIKDLCLTSQAADTIGCVVGGGLTAVVGGALSYIFANDPSWGAGYAAAAAGVGASGTYTMSKPLMLNRLSRKAYNKFLDQMSTEGHAVLKRWVEAKQLPTADKLRPHTTLSQDSYCQGDEDRLSQFNWYVAARRLNPVEREVVEEVVFHRIVTVNNDQKAVETKKPAEEPTIKYGVEAAGVVLKGAVGKATHWLVD